MVSLTLSSLDLHRRTVQLQLHPTGQRIDLALGQRTVQDLDVDTKNDLSILFRNIYVNRVELTLTALASSSEHAPRVEGIAQAAASPTVASSSRSAGCTYPFKRDLQIGMEGADVKELQSCLQHLLFPVLDKRGKPLTRLTTVFGPATKAALIKYQAASKLPAFGYFGSMTRNAIKKKVR
jgi:hypothetical protein